MLVQDYQVIQLGDIIARHRAWYAVARSNYKIHPVIFDALKIARPANWHALTLEYPHLAKDGMSIAYYQTDKKGAAGVATTTKPGKYLTRHFPQLCAHQVRDLVAPYVCKVEIIDNMETMLETIIHGPHSCMANDDFAVHPYSVYNPVYGWKMARRVAENGEIIGRALINDKTFVRCYAGSKSGDYAKGADNILESWLLANGFEKATSWPKKTKIERITHRGRLVAPYIDGSRDNLIECGEYCAIVDDGDYSATNTDGYAEELDAEICNDCGCRVSDDDITWVNDEYCVCSDCLNSYVFIEGRRINGRWRGDYYIPESDAVCVNGNWYPADSVSDYGIIELHDGDYAELDDAIYVDDAEEYYLASDQGTEFEYCEDVGEYRTEWHTWADGTCNAEPEPENENENENENESESK